MVEMGEELVRVEDVYKIFGPQPRGRAFELSQGGMGKGEVHARTGHVVGLRDVNFNVKRGEIFVIMGLSGSGKSTAIRTVNKLLDTTNGTSWSTESMSRPSVGPTCRNSVAR